MPVGEVHGVENEPKHQHHIDKVHHIDKSVEKLSVSESFIIRSVEKALNSPVSEGKHCYMDSE